MIKSTTLLLLAALTVLCAQNALAQNEQSEHDGSNSSARPKLRTPPEGWILTPTDKGAGKTAFYPDQEYKLFTRSEWAEMAHILMDYDWLWWYSYKLEAKLALYQLSIANLEEQNQALREQLELSDVALHRMSGLLDTEQRQRAREARSARRTLWFYRTATVLSIGLAAGFGIGYAVERGR